MTAAIDRVRPPAGDNDDELFRRHRHTGERELHAQLVADNLGLAEAMARRYAGRGEDDDDLRQVAVIGLMKAIDRFDPDQGHAFSTFAVPTILGELKHHFRDAGWTIRVPRRIKELRRHCNRAHQELQHRLHRAPTLAEIAEELGEHVDEVEVAIMGVRDCYRPQRLEASTPLQSVEADTTEDVACREVLLEDLLAGLASREQRIFVLRYYEDLTQQEIAEQVGISQMHVSRLLRSGLEDLRAVA